MTIHAILRDCAVDLLETEPNVTLDKVVECAYRRNADAFAQESLRMVKAAARTVVANILRDLIDDDGDGQLALPGMTFPSAIAVQTPTGTYYVRTDKATWPELQAGRQLRAENVERAQAKLDAYDESLDMVRAVMENDERITLAEAVEKMAAKA